jgi:hypothetical protein
LPLAAAAPTLPAGSAPAGPDIAAAERTVPAVMAMMLMRMYRLLKLKKLT